MIKIKNINLILLSILLNNNLNSMHPRDVKEKEKERETISQDLDPMQIDDTEESEKIELLNLPEEIIQLIIYKIIDPKLIESYIEKIKKIDNIVTLYSIEKKNIKKGLKKELINLLLTSKSLNNSVLASIKNAIIQILRIREKELRDNSIYRDRNLNSLNIGLKYLILDRKPIRVNLERAVELILVGADVNAINNDYETALMLAVYKNYKDIVKLLLNKGANPNIQDRVGNTALMFAVNKGYKDIVKLLLNKGADPNLQTEYGNTALIWATKRTNKDIVKLLLNKNADINIQNKLGSTALILATKKNNKDIVELLLNKNADINIQNNYGNTALRLAKSKGYTDIVKLIKAKTNQGNNFCLVS